jgi:hypothetical protein
LAFGIYILLSTAEYQPAIEVATIRALFENL